MRARVLVLLACLACVAGCTRAEPRALSARSSVRSCVVQPAVSPALLGSRPAHAQRTRSALLAPKPVQAQRIPSASPATVKADESILQEDLGRRYCVGGVACIKHCAAEGAGCEVRNVYVVRLEQPADIARIRLTARDTVDPSRWPDLVVRLDGALVGNVPPYPPGAGLDVVINRTGQLITVEALPRSEQVLPSDVGAVISDLKVLGRAHVDAVGTR